MTERPEEFDYHLPNHGEDDRPGLDEADYFVDDEDENTDAEDVDDDDLDDEDEDETDEYDDEDEYDYPDDATSEDVDIAIAVYREDGVPTSIPLELEFVNDLDALITYLRRLPGDAGAMAMISLAGDVFVLVRVRGKNVQVYLSDDTAANDWPLAHDIVDYLGEEVPDEEDDPESLGDAAILADMGLHEIDLEAMTSDYDEDTTVVLQQIATKIQFGTQFRTALIGPDE